MPASVVGAGGSGVRADAEGGDADLPWGCDEMPGFAHLAAFHPLLFVGNERSAACADFGCVVSTVEPRDRDGAPAPQLTTDAIHFPDGQGGETADGTERARRCISDGAGVVAAALAAGKRTLVHCSWGQNRSGAICCAFAVRHGGWADAGAAIAYMRERNHAERHYNGQQPPGGPMHNGVFNEIVAEMAAEMATSMATSAR